MTAILSSMARPALIALPSAPTVAVPQGTRTAAPHVVFPAQGYGECQQRYIHNPNAAGSIWVNLLGGVPAANAEGSFEIAPGGRWADAINNEVRVVFTAAAMSITAYER